MQKISDGAAALRALEPPSVRNDPEVKAITEALGPVFEELCRHLEDGLTYSRVADLTSGQLDHLAMQWQPLVWRDSWTIDLKRRMLANMIAQKRRMGTVEAVRSYIKGFGSSARFTEWWQQSPQGTPHTFSIVISQKQLAGTVSAEVTLDLIRSIELTKPVRSQYELTIVETREADLRLTGGAKTGSFFRAGFRPVFQAKLNGTARLTGGAMAITYTRINSTSEAD